MINKVVSGWVCFWGALEENGKRNLAGREADIFGGEWKGVAGGVEMEGKEHIHPQREEEPS